MSTIIERPAGGVSGTLGSLQPAAVPPNWVKNAALLWMFRRRLCRVVAISLVLSLTIAFLIPKRYTSTARMMPPDQSGSSTLMLAALAGHATGLSGLSALAGGLLSGHSSSALMVDLLRSGTVGGHLVARFHLQQVYGSRYRVDAAKKLAHRTTVTDDKKSGIVTVSVWDTDRVRARDLAQAYLDELNQMLSHTSASSAHQERLFIESRLRSVQNELENAQLDLSEFSSSHTAIDLKEQTRAVVDSGAKLQAQLLVEQSGLASLRQIYGDSNVRVRASEARIGALEHELRTLSGSSTVPASDEHAISLSHDGQVDYPALRQLPRLAVPYADLYRKVKVRETVFDLLTQQYELARIQEAKDIPVISVVDAPGIAEKKSFPPRLLLALALTTLAFAAASAHLLLLNRWRQIEPSDLRRVLARQVRRSVERRIRLATGRGRRR
jgi:capsule polysaccharide export protein KpsE/RkpR